MQHFILDKSKKPHIHLITFILNNIAMIPAANLLGFAGQEVAQKLPHVMGMVIETSLGSITEIILFMTLLAKHNDGSRTNFIPVIQAAILGSILANLLLCVGLCLFAGGIRRHEVKFDSAVSEVGSNLLLVAGMGKSWRLTWSWTCLGRFQADDHAQDCSCPRRSIRPWRPRLRSRSWNPLRSRSVD